MNQPDDVPDKFSNMRYFTPQLVLQLNSSNSQTVDHAMGQWEGATAAYRKNLQRIRHEMPSQSRPITELSLHDWNLLKVVANPETSRPKSAVTSASIVLEHDREIVILWYSLSQKLKVIGAPREWSLSRKSVHWLYDEVDTTGNGQESFVHRILFSDGATLLVPFSSCRVVQMKSDHAMSHSDLMQIA